MNSILRKVFKYCYSHRTVTNVNLYLFLEWLSKNGLLYFKKVGKYYV